MDFLSDMIARLENGQGAQKTQIYLKQNKICLRVIQILQNEGFISHQSLVTVEKENKNFSKEILKKSSKRLASKEIKVYFKRQMIAKNMKTSFYYKIFHISRVSKGSRRIQIKVKDLWKLEQGLGIQLLSTNRGLITDREARLFKVGGEVLCKIRLFFLNLLHSLRFKRIFFKGSFKAYFPLDSSKVGKNQIRRP